MSEAEPIPPTSSVTALRIPMIKKGEYDLWSMKMRQYIAITDHILWDIITNGDQATTDPASSSAPKTSLAANARRNNEKALNILLFSQFLIDISIATMIRGQPGLDELEFDDLYNNLKVYEHELKGVSNSSSQNIAFLSTEVKGSTLKQSTADPANIPKGYTQAASSKVQTAPNCASHSDEIICSFFAQQASMPTTHDDEDLLQIDEDAMEEIDIRWQVAMITARIRKFMRKTGRPIDLKPKNGITFDKSKIECFNCQKLGHFARECRFAKYQENRANGRNEKRIVAIEDSNSKALVATDNNEDIDWTKEFDAEPVTFAMMALTEVEQDDWSMEFDAEHVHFGQDGLGDFDWSNKADDTPVSLALMATNSEVPYCSKCSKSYKKLLESYQTERDNFQKARTEILGYQMSLESLEVILKTHEKNEYAWGDKDDFKVKLEKWTNASVLQNEVLNKQRYLSDKSCIGFGIESSSSMESDISSGDETLTDSLYENFKREKAYKAVPPPTGTIIPPRANVSFTGIDELAIRNKVVNQEKTKSSQPEIDRNKVIIEDWVDSDDEETDVSEIQKKTVFNSENSETSFENRSPNSQNSVGQESRTKGLGNKGGKLCFVCYSPNHLIKNCNLHDRTFKQTQTHKPKGTQGSRDTRPVWNNINRVNHSNFSGNSRYPHQRRSFIPLAVLTRDGLKNLEYHRQYFHEVLMEVIIQGQGLAQGLANPEEEQRSCYYCSGFTGSIEGSQYWNDEPIATFKGRNACKEWTLKEDLLLFLRGEIAFQDTQTDCIQDTAQRMKLKRLKASIATMTRQTDAEQRRPTIKKLEVKQVEFKLGEDCWEIQISIRSDLYLEDAGGTDFLPTATIFEELARMGVKPLFTIMMVQANQEEGVDSDIPTDSQQTPITTQPSTSRPQKKQSRRKQIKDIKISQSSASTEPITKKETNKESVPTHSNDPLPSGEDRLKLTKLMDLCTKLSARVLALETTKTTQALEIASLKNRVKKLEKKANKRTQNFKRLYKVGTTRRVESLNDEGLGAQKDASKHGRSIEDIDKDAEVSLVDETQGSAAEILTTTGIKIIVSTAALYTTAVSPPVITEVEITLAQTLAELKSAKSKVVIQEPVQSTVIIAPSIIPKAKGITFRDDGETITRTSTPVSSLSIKDKRKAKLVEPEVPLKKKDQIRLDEELARRLDAKEQEAARLERENEQEQGELTIKEKSKLFMELINERKRHFAKLRAEEKRRKTLTKEIQKAFDKTMGWINNFKPMDYEEVKGSEKKAESSEKKAEGSRKKSIDEHEEAEEDDEAEMKKHMEIVQDEEEIVIDVLPLATKPPMIVEYKIVKEGQKGFYH
ncbi:ribonuclease H-like domain-containing protein [Tanacetum coccineum]